MGPVQLNLPAPNVALSSGVTGNRSGRAGTMSTIGTRRRERGGRVERRKVQGPQDVAAFPPVACRRGAVEEALPCRVRATGARAELLSTGFGPLGVERLAKGLCGLEGRHPAAGTATGSPVRGLRHWRAARVRAANFPIAATVTVSPWASASAMVEVRALRRHWPSRATSGPQRGHTTPIGSWMLSKPVFKVDSQRSSGSCRAASPSAPDTSGENRTGKALEDTVRGARSRCIELSG